MPARCSLDARPRRRPPARDRPGPAGGRPVGRGRHGQHVLAVAVDVLDLEPVLGQRPGLVGEQHGHRSDGLGGAQPAQEHAVLGQAQAADRHERRHEDRQLLGDRGERQRQPVEQHLACGLAAEHADERHDDAAVTATISARARVRPSRAERRGRLPRVSDEPAEATDSVSAPTATTTASPAPATTAVRRAAARSARRAARRRRPARAPWRPPRARPSASTRRWPGRRPRRRGRRRRRGCRPRRAVRRRSRARRLGLRPRRPPAGRARSGR